MKRAKRARGFTLVEVLVVLAVVVMLASLVFAAFSRVRENGRKSACQSNLKHLALAVQQYVQDNNGRYPHFGAEIQGLLPYVKDPQIYFCPSLNQNGILQFGYAPNIERLNQLISSNPQNRIWVGRGEAPLPQVATIWLHSDIGENSNYVTVSSSCGRTAIGLKWHFGGANYSFLDGHVKWLTPQALGEIECSNPPLNPSGP